MTTRGTAALLPRVDELVLEYLLFRGFTRSFQALATERKRDRAKGFDVEAITAQLLAFIQTYQLEAILDTWKFLDARFFSRLDGSYTATISQLEDSWLRLYLVNATKNGNREKTVEFFRLLADKLNAKAGTSSSDGWHRWFILPYVQHPESDPFFRPFFEKQWLETFVTSFRNFLSLIFRNMALPKLLALQAGRLEESALKLRLKSSQSECSRLRHHNAQAAERIHRLEDAGRKMLRVLETLVHHAFAEHFVDTEDLGWSDRIVEDQEEESAAVKTLKAVSSQLRDLRDVFGASTRENISFKDDELAAALLDPLSVKLNAAMSATGDGTSDQDPAIAIVGLSSSPSSSSLQSAESGNSPVHRHQKLLQPTLNEELTLQVDESGDAHDICRYSHNGGRIIIGRTGQQIIQVFDVNLDNRLVERDQIRTESPVVGADWIARSECLIYALEDGTVTIWDTENKSRTFIISYNADERRPSHLACSRSSPIGAVALVSNEAESTDGRRDVRLQFFSFENHAIRVLSSIDLAEPVDLLTLKWASDGSNLAVAEQNGRISLISPRDAKSLGCWRLVSPSAALAGIAFGSDDQSLLVVESTGDRVVEWSVPDLIESSNTADTPQPRMSYQLPREMIDEALINLRHLDIQAIRSMLAVSTSTAPSASYWTIFKLGQSEPLILKPLHVADQVNGIAWHPRETVLAVTTTTSKLYCWKLSE